MLVQRLWLPRPCVWAFPQCSLSTCWRTPLGAHLSLCGSRCPPEHAWHSQRGSQDTVLTAPHGTCSLARWRPAAHGIAFVRFLADLGCHCLTPIPGQALGLLCGRDTGLPSATIWTYKVGASGPAHSLASGGPARERQAPGVVRSLSICLEKLARS